MTDSRSHASQGNDRVLLGYDAIEESDLVGMAMDVKEALVAVGMNVRGAPVESSLARRSVTAVDICSEGAYLVEDGTKATEQARQLRMAHVVPGVE